MTYTGVPTDSLYTDKPQAGTPALFSRVFTGPNNSSAKPPDLLRQEK